ncbi:MAG: hypothetical protein ACRCZ2_12065, partial [Fusobacteriaceae bacterium]
EHQTAFHPDGIATRIFREGVALTPWKHIQGVGGGGADVDLSAIEERFLLVEADIQTLKDALFINQTLIANLQRTQGVHETQLIDHEERLADIEAGGLIDLQPIEDRLFELGAGHENQDARIEALELGGGPGSVDLAPLIERLTLAEAGHTDQETRIEALEGNMPPTTFMALTDTPVDYAGAANKSIRVNADGDGLEFIPSPEIGIMQALENGNLPIKWNNMKQKIAASSSTISSSQIANNAFTIGLGGSTGRYYDLPDIVDADTSPLPANSVREGRLTIISQQGGGHRTARLTGGCKFYSAGVTSTEDLVIPTGQSWILLPAIFGNGDKNWSIIGSFSANQYNSDAFNGY